MNFTYQEHVKTEMYQREAGLRKAQLNGVAYEPRLRREFPWPWRRNRGGDPRQVQLRPGVQGG